MRAPKVQRMGNSLTGGNVIYIKKIVNRLGGGDFFQTANCKVASYRHSDPIPPKVLHSTSTPLPRKSEKEKIK